MKEEMGELRYRRTQIAPTMSFDQLRLSARRTVEKLLWSMAGLPVWDAAIAVQDTANATLEWEGVRRSARRSQFPLSPARFDRGRDHYRGARFVFRPAWQRKGRTAASR